jgi:N-dimethylarginine dimethylaminohydrolase
MGVELLLVPLTGYRLHIDGQFVDRPDTALLNPTQLPFWFLEKLKELRIRTIEVSHEDRSGIVNCLTVRPGRLIMPEGVSERRARRRAPADLGPGGAYEALSLGGGGIHCSTGPRSSDPL